MPGDININIDKLPESPWFWLIVVILVVVGLFAAGKVATAFLVLDLGVGIICLIANLSSDNPSNGLWGVIIFCAFFAVVLGAFAVPSEWSTPTVSITPISTPTRLSLAL